ncbi:MAG TPA: vWA domain-containing protein [Polyangiaceae bacterium]|nr:vWA domain-containing protein [Polyangiaceae bacterium]
MSWRFQVFTALALIGVGCSPKSTSSEDVSGIGGTSSAGGFPNGTGNTMSVGGIGSGTGGDGPIFDPGHPPPSSDGPDASCGAQAASAENVVETVTETVTEQVPQPVAIYIMLDQSASMVGPKWTAAVGAITAFLTDQKSAGLDVAFQIFPNNFPPLPSGCSNCAGTDCAVPMYAMGQLPGAAAAITGDLAQRLPFGLGTPIEAGLRGSTQFCASYQSAHPEEKCAVVFITDGAPSTCATGQDLVNIAGAALTQNKVQTFTVGMDGADYTLLDQIAQAGGTDCTPNAPSFACNATDTQSFLTALEGIRTTITVTHEVTHEVTHTKPVACEYSRPDVPDGKAFDKSKVNVEYTTGGVKTDVLHTDSVSTCPPEGGWYYDDNDAPTKILVCPSTCTTITSLTDITFNVLFGCETKNVPAR